MTEGPFWKLFRDSEPEPKFTPAPIPAVPCQTL